MAAEQARIKAIFADALEREPAARAAYLLAACGDDETVLDAVRALLAANEDAEVFLDTPTGAWESVRAFEHLPLPEQIGQYRITRRIASGGAGSVYEAVQERPHRTVAIKLLHAGMATGDLARRFERESQVLAQLHHPGIAHVYESGFQGEHGWGMPYIAMELVRDARTIVDYANEQDLDPTSRIELFLTVCRAVQHGHERGIVHRDLKPHNILVDAAGHAKVIDFGVARVTEADDRALTQHTSIGDIIGTLLYMSPEQCALDPRRIDERADIYALGVVLFELLTGRLPLDPSGLPLDEALDAIRTRPPARISRVAGHLGPDLDAICSMTLEKDRSRRYQTVSALAADLQRHLDHQPVVARPPSLAYQAQLFARRHRVAVTAGAVVLVILVAATITSFVFAVRASGAAERETHQRLVAERIASHLEAMLAAPNPHLQGEDVTVVELLDATIQRLDDMPEELPEVEAAVRTSVGGTYLMQRRLASAETQLRKSVAIWQDIDPEGPETAEALNMLGLALLEQGEKAAAEPYYQAAVPIARKHADHPKVDLPGILSNLANTLVALGRYAEAEPFARETLDLRRRQVGDRHIYIAAGLRSLARLRAKQDDPDGQVALLDEALVIVRETTTETHPIYAATIIDHSEALLAAGRLDDALTAGEEGWTLTAAARPVGSPDWDDALHTYVNALVANDRHDDAIALLETGVDELIRERGADHRYTRDAQERLAELRVDGR